MGRLEGRTAIVTGASRGLGRAIAMAMAAEGAKIAVAARTVEVWDERLPGTIGETVAAIIEAGGRAVAIQADLLEPEDRRRLVEDARTALGPISILVNNAAFTAPGRPPRAGEGAKPQRAPAAGANSAAKADFPTFVTTPLPAYRRHFELVFAAYELSQLVVPDMLAAGGGAIVNISSGASRMPGEGPYPARSDGVLAGYGGSKAALEHLTQCCAYELADRRIVINALAPTLPIMTPGLAYYSRGHAETATPEAFAEAAVRLCLVDPSRVTGRVLGHADVLDGSFGPYVYRGRPGQAE
ncbi:MAG: SDR family oxidoreductase [Caulobacteraceae bacterium]|nr:SDR family oxidoreductase [Caulobacteraceae bacterium]